MFIDRSYAFFGANRAAVAMEVRGDKLIFALAFCNRRDTFSKDKARYALDGRIDARLDPDFKKHVKHTFVVTYKGKHSRRDVMSKVMDRLRQLPRERKHAEIVSTVDDIAEQLSELVTV